MRDSDDSGADQKPAHQHLIRGSDLPREAVSHPLNANSAVDIRRLGRAAGLTRLGINHGRLAPGSEAFVYRSHEGEEEFIYILSGCGVLRTDTGTVKVGPGDLLGFPTPSVAHQLTNPFDEDLMYLMGSEDPHCADAEPVDS